MTGFDRKMVREVTKELGIELREMSKDETRKIVCAIGDKYAGGGRSGLIWNGVERASGFEGEEALIFLEDISEINDGKDLVLIVDPGLGQAAFRFRDVKDILAIQGQHLLDDFYITNDDTDFMVCFTHHDALVACGKAMEWLRGKVSPGDRRFFEVPRRKPGA